MNSALAPTPRRRNVDRPGAEGNGIRAAVTFLSDQGGGNTVCPAGPGSSTLFPDRSAMTIEITGTDRRVRPRMADFMDSTQLDVDVHTVFDYLSENSNLPHYFARITEARSGEGE